MRIIILGFGVVGRALAKLLWEETPKLTKQYGIKPIIIGIADRRGAVYNEKGLNIPEVLDVKRKYGTVSKHPDGVMGMTGTDLINTVYSDVMIEVTPTNLDSGEPGLTHIREALKAGVNVVTSNKGPLALAMPALVELAEYNGVAFRFSGTVGGGTPILDYGRRLLAGDSIEEVEGILNGTTNYILTRMTEGLEFEEALEEARLMGYAERDPSMDLDGLDAACKLIIMANYIMGLRVTLGDVRVEGIRGISREEVAEAYRRGYAIKLIASIVGDSLEVKPMEVPVRDPICVWGTLNAVTFKCRRLGEQTIIGRGAGGVETALSIIRDLVEIKHRLTRGG
ncbi:homoserine dehydrogenase [Candidatus Woesearchaeota archaeon]|nr:MAG: homoserine dehydrogenase [Candidatus Woesearchaeota archaeon]